MGRELGFGGTKGLHAAGADWQGRLQRVFEDAKLVDGHAHRFHGTFAVELLLPGVPFERVSILLGHASIKVTEQHHTPWVRERQEQAEAGVKRTWLQDPVALLDTKRTREVYGKRAPLN